MIHKRYNYCPYYTTILYYSILYIYIITTIEVHNLEYLVCCTVGLVLEIAWSYLHLHEFHRICKPVESLPNNSSLVIRVSCVYVAAARVDTKALHVPTCSPVETGTIARVHIIVLVESGEFGAILIGQ